MYDKYHYTFTYTYHLHSQCKICVLTTQSTYTAHNKQTLSLTAVTSQYL